MKTPYLIMERSAMGEQQRYLILSNELLSRLSTLHRKIGIAEKLRIVTKQVKSSGYSRQQCRHAVVSGLLGYLRKLERKARSGKKMYRSAASTMSKRVRKNC